MAVHNQLFSEAVGLLDRIVPAHATAATYQTGWVDVSLFSQFAGIIAVGVLGSSATIAAKFQQANTSGGGTPKDIAGKAIAGLTQTPTDNSNSVQFINCRADELDLANNYRWVQLSITVGTATSDIFGAVMGVDSKYGPASDHDNANVTQYVN